MYSKGFSLIRPWQYPEEFLGLLAEYKKLDASCVMEIGTANGGTLFAHCKLASDNALLISLDLPDGLFGGGYPEWKIPVYEEFAKSNQSLYLLRADSHLKETETQIRSILKDRMLDYLFIDGDHTYEGVKEDFEMYSPLVKKGGMIVFHDIADHEESSCKVDVFWNEVKNDYEHIEFVKDKNVGCFGIGVLYK
jgi:cephalosporin hydroxylase